MKEHAFGLTLQRSGDEGAKASAASSMFKYYGTEHNKDRYELMIAAMGNKGLGWTNEGFSDDEQAITKAWDEIKAQEKNKKDIHKTFAGIPASLPPILKAKKIQKKASKKGFDWKESIDVIEKVEEELKELKHEIQQNNKENSQEELGDLLFSIINLSRHLEIDASEAINQANHKFIKRFRLMEEEIAKDKKDLDNLSPEELEEFWVKIKSHG